MRHSMLLWRSVCLSHGRKRWFAAKIHFVRRIQISLLIVIMVAITHGYCLCRLSETVCACLSQRLASIPWRDGRLPKSAKPCRRSEAGFASGPLPFLEYIILDNTGTLLDMAILRAEPEIDLALKDGAKLPSEDMFFAAVDLPDELPGTWAARDIGFDKSYDDEEEGWKTGVRRLRESE